MGKFKTPSIRYNFPCVNHKNKELFFSYSNFYSLKWNEWYKKNFLYHLEYWQFANGRYSA